MKIKEYKVNLENYGECMENSELICGTVCLEKKEDAFLIKADLGCVFYPYGYSRVFERYSSLVITAGMDEVDKILVQHTVSPFWVEPDFCNSTTKIPQKSQYVLIKNSNDYTFLLPVSDENNQTVIQAGKKENEIEICVNCVSPDCLTIQGTLLVAARSKSPYDAIEKGFRVAWEMKLLKTPPKTQKKFPDILNSFGWCTWNAFYHDVSEKAIFEKMEEFKNKKIPVKWVLIDDGWSDTDENMRLRSIYENKEKFPHGLKHTVDILKEKYGVKSVGVWYSATGYWRGLGFKSKNTFSASPDVELPGNYEFFSEWNTYLKSQGIDFVKIDTQGNLNEYIKGNHLALKRIVNIQKGIDKAAQENFDFIINCMGMDNINMFNRPSSIICRNSDDFFPDRNDILKKHIVQNAYNAIFTDQLYYCDFDMWWSNHFEAKQNAVLRAMSGGPFYVSDRLNESNPEIIRMFVNEDGMTKRYECSGKPTEDCIFGFDKFLKLFNKKGSGFAVAIFSFENSGNAVISAKDFGGTGEYCVTEKFTGKQYFLAADKGLDVSLARNDVKMFEFTKYTEDIL